MPRPRHSTKKLLKKTKNFVECPVQALGKGPNSKIGQPAQPSIPNQKRLSEPSQITSVTPIVFLHATCLPASRRLATASTLYRPATLTPSAPLGITPLPHHGHRSRNPVRHLLSERDTVGGMNIFEYLRSFCFGLSIFFG